MKSFMSATYLSSFFTSSKCKPVVGSSSTYRVAELVRRASSRASFTLWASPPESVGAGWPSVTYPSPTSQRVCKVRRILGMFSNSLTAAEEGMFNTSAIVWPK